MRPQTFPSFAAFAGFVGAVFAMGSLGIDAVLPALPDLDRSLAIGGGNEIQFVVTGFVIGMGAGTLIGGPLSDRYGRRSVILAGCLLYASAALVAPASAALPRLVGLRALQGAGAAFAYVATTALVRDRFEGAEMARLMSLAAMVFAAMPAIAPLMGQALVHLGGWKLVFAAFAALAGALALHVWRRIPDAAAPTPVRLRSLAGDAVGILRRADVRRPVLAQLFNMAALFSVLASIQPIFDRGFGRAAGFAGYFTLMALAVLLSSWANGRLLARFAPMQITRSAFAGQIAVSLLVLLVCGAGLPFDVFVAWAMGVFVMNGLTMGNLNAQAMRPLAAQAGLGATLVSAAGTIGGGVLAVPVGLAFDGTPTPLILSILVFATLSRLAVVSKDLK